MSLSMTSPGPCGPAHPYGPCAPQPFPCGPLVVPHALFCPPLSPRRCRPPWTATCSSTTATPVPAGCCRQTAGAQWALMRPRTGDVSATSQVRHPRHPPRCAAVISSFRRRYSLGRGLTGPSQITELAMWDPGRLSGGPRLRDSKLMGRAQQAWPLREAQQCQRVDPAVGCGGCGSA